MKNILQKLWNLLPTTKAKNNVNAIVSAVSNAVTRDSASSESVTDRRQPTSSDRRGTSQPVVSPEDTSVSTPVQSDTMASDYMKDLESMLSSFGSNIGSALNDIFGITSATAMNNLNELKMWMLNNQYNSPEEQMQRFKAAGLNPNLIYGNGSASAGNSSQPSTHEIPAGMGAQMGMNVANAGSQIGKTLSEISNIEANTAKQKKEADMLTYSILREKQGVQNDIQEYERLKALTENVKSQTRLNELEAIYKEYQNSTISLDLLQRKYNLKQSEMDLLETRARIANIEQTTTGMARRLDMDIWTFNHVDRLEAIIKQNDVVVSDLDRLYKEMYGQSHAATEGMSGVIGNVTKFLTSSFGEAKYLFNNRKNKKQ